MGKKRVGGGKYTKLHIYNMMLSLCFQHLCKELISFCLVLQLINCLSATTTPRPDPKLLEDHKSELVSGLEETTDGCMDYWKI